MSKIFIDAGHWDLDPGARYCVAGTCSYAENQLTKELRDKLKEKMSALWVPDNLNLRDSIKWVNERAAPEDLAISLHFNKNASVFLNGAEGYYWIDPRLAEIFSRNVARELGIYNRGPKPDTATYVGELGWLRQLKCKTVLVEVCFLSNMADMKEYSHENAANGIIDAIEEAGIQRPAPKPTLTPEQYSYFQNALSRILAQLNIILQNKKMLGIFQKRFGAAGDEWHPAIASSVNPKEVSLRVKAWLVAILPTALIVLNSPIVGLNITNDEALSLIDVVVLIVEAGSYCFAIALWLKGKFRAK